MSYIDRVLRVDRLFERFDELSEYTNMLEVLTERAGEMFPQHAQQLEAMTREARAAKDAARLDIDFEP